MFGPEQTADLNQLPLALCPEIKSICHIMDFYAEDVFLINNV